MTSQIAMATSTLTLDLEKALQMPNVVAAGNFEISQRLQGAKGDPLRKRESFIQDLKRSINGDADLRQLLLNKAQLRQWSVIPHSQALLVQHRSVWTQKASGMLQTSEDFLRQVTDVVRSLYGLRQAEEKVNQSKKEAFPTDKEAPCFDMETCLVELAQRQIDYEELEASLTTRVVATTVSCQHNPQNLVTLSQEVDSSIIDLRRQEEDLMKKLFWLNSSTSSQAKASSAAVFKVKADEGEQEEAAAGEKPVRFPICTALSPSSKAKALAAKMGHNPEQKRLSLDSGYADSNDNANSDEDEHECEEKEPESPQKKELAKSCDKCSRKMTAKFDFDKLDKDGDPEAWVVFNCSMCTSREDLDEDLDDEESDFLTDQFNAILQDITVYYNKKLDMYRIKMEHHQRTRPDGNCYDLAFMLMDIYSHHPNRQELWKDMFCQILDSTTLQASSIQRWMQEEMQIKAAMKACIHDIRRERDKILDGMCKLQAKTQERKVRLKEHQSKQKEQLQHCQQLRTKLQVLRLSKQEQERLQQKSQVEEQKRLEILKVKRRKSFRVRQRAQWAEIKSYRRNQEEIKAERRFHLHQELKATVKRRRQQALQDFIRVNLRKVMAEQKSLERKAAIAAKEADEREKDARLETLRKSARRRLGIGVLGNSQTAFLPTVASASKIRYLGEEELEEELKRPEPHYKLYTFTDEEIMSDPRVVVENVLRERGLLNGSKYAVDQIMREFKPPRIPRPDTKSQLSFIKEEED